MSIEVFLQEKGVIKFNDRGKKSEEGCDKNGIVESIKVNKEKALVKGSVVINVKC